MVSNELNAETIQAAIINGCYRLIEQRDELNRINVFPVADGDTGDNMASVCFAIIECSEVRENITLTFKSIAQAAITGSRGNSGILLTQFFVGLHQHLPASNNLCFKDLCSALRATAEEIDSVLSAPVEGTIITLIKKFAEFINLQKPLGSIAKTMRAIIPLLKEEVGKTTARLKILQESKVVDAGALGFYYFIEGVTDFLEQGIPVNSPTVNKIHPSLDPDHTLCGPPQFRYCTEAVLKNASISQQDLLQQLRVVWKN